MESISTLLSEWDKGWLSALIDGEGSLYIGFQKQKTSPRPRVMVGLSITNASEELILRAQKLLGGSVRLRKGVGNRKDTYVIHVHANGVRRILPHLNLIVKRRQKEVCLEALSLLEGFGKGSRKGFQGGLMRPLWKDERFAELKAEMNTLNRRGKPKAVPTLLVATRIE